MVKRQFMKAIFSKKNTILAKTLLEKFGGEA